jgi:hypothetical protein
MNNIPYLIPDIFYIVFEYLDDVFLKYLKYACKNWYNIISYHLQKKTKKLLDVHCIPRSIPKVPIKIYKNLITNLYYLNSENFYLIDFIKELYHDTVKKSSIVDLTVSNIKISRIEIHLEKLIEQFSGFILFK